MSGSEVKAAKAPIGDSELEALRRHGFGVAYRMLGSVAEAEDVAQEALLRLTSQEDRIDEPAPASEWLPYLAACAGAKPPMRVPTWLARLLAGDVAVAIMTEGRGFANAKARRELGWQLRYPSWRQGFKGGLA